MNAHPLPTLEEKQQLYCAGCRNDFYNHRSEPGFDGATKCWSLADSYVVRRFKIGWWTPKDRASNFTEVTTLDCHHAPGNYAMFKELPEHLLAQAHEVRK